MFLVLFVNLSLPLIIQNVICIKRSPDVHFGPRNNQINLGDVPHYDADAGFALRFNTVICIGSKIHLI